MSNMMMYRMAGCLVACAAFGLGCASQQQPRAEHSSAATQEAPPPEPVSGAPECVDDKDQPVECLSDADCCQGFVCGKDPERSHRISYCIYGG